MLGAPIAVPEAELLELRRRIRAARWPRPWPLERPLESPVESPAGAQGRGAGESREDGWAAGANPDALRRLAEYWADGFDWRAQERAINALPWHVATIDGVPVHYLRFDGGSPDSVPVVLSHGWPSTFLEEVELARHLSRPEQHGVAGERSFTVIVPSLPGFGLTPEQAVMPGFPTHELWHGLMTGLGFTRYVAHGGDLGAGISARLAQAHPEAVAGLHVLAVADPVDQSRPTEAETEYLARGRRWYDEEGGYEHLQRTRPLTLAYGLNDSPLGLLAWLLEKYRAWSDHGDRVSGLDDDLILTHASLYWFTGAIAASFRPYWEHRHFPPGPVRVSVPTGLAVFPADLAQPPRSWAERNYNVVRYTLMPRGGHFAAVEEPALLAADIRAFAAGLA